VRGERSASVEIPPGVSTNNYLTLRGQGEAGPRNAPAGDLLVLIDVLPDERFERDGDDLIHDLPVSFSLAALGGVVRVPTPYGEEEVKVPSGLQSGTVLRLRGKGLPRLGHDGHGDLNVRTHVWTPESLNAEQRKLFEALTPHEQPPVRGSEGGFWSRIKEALVA
jgi:molecular chaperone DnaJ